MLTASEQHVKDDASGEYIDALRISFLEDELRPHEDESANLLVKRAERRMLVFGAQTEIRDFDCREVIQVSNEDIVRLEVPVDDVVVVEVGNCLKDALDDL